MFLLSCGNDVKLHSCTHYELVHAYRPADTTGPIRNISWCRDGSLLSVVPYKGSPEILRPNNDDLKLVQTLLSITSPSTAVFQRTTKKTLAVATSKGGILIYDIKSRSIRKRFSTDGASISMLDWSLKDTHLAVARVDGLINIYSNTTNQKSITFKVPGSKSVSVIRYHSLHRNTLGSASDEGAIAVWDVNTGKQICYMRSHQAPVTDLVFSNCTSNLLMSVGLDRNFQAYDTNTGEVALNIVIDHPLSAIDMAANGYTVALASIKGVLYVHDLRNLKTPAKVIIAHTGEIKRVLFQPFCPDNVESDFVFEDKPTQMVCDAEVPAVISTGKNISTDSFANILSPRHDSHMHEQGQPVEQDEIHKKKSDSVMNDSFFCDWSPHNVATSYSVEKSNEMFSLGVTEGVKKWLGTSPFSSQIVEEHKEKSSDVPSILSAKPSSSTPRIGSKLPFIQNQDLLDSNVSPIVPQNIKFDDIQKAVKEIVIGIMENGISDLKNMMHKEFMSLQLTFSKQFVLQEEFLERLVKKNLSNNDLLSQNISLKEENEFLKNEIERLKQMKK